MISFCEQILLMLNILMISYLLFNKVQFTRDYTG